MPRVGPDRQRRMVDGYGIRDVLHPFSNGANIAATITVSAVPWVQFYQLAGNIHFQSPYTGNVTPVPKTFVRPTTMLAMDRPRGRPMRRIGTSPTGGA
jgi:hypothetical protein